MGEFRIWLAEHLLHIGWAMMGQECACGYNRFNWLARLMGEGQWIDGREPATRWTAIKCWVGERLIDAHGRLYSSAQGPEPFA